MTSKATVHGPEVFYALHTLGWKAFQDLCIAVATEVLGKPIETFLSSRDGGRDGAFVGAASGRKSTIQCKSTSRPSATIALTDVASELSKVASLASRGLADDYILMTNLGVSGVAAAELQAAFTKAGVKTFQVFGREWISTQIRERPRLRMMVPRVYGLGDLSQIIDQRAYKQARYILSAMGDDLRCFVTTDAHRRSVEALTRHGFVLLLGDPASGKSTIGATLAIGALDDGAIGTIKVTSPADFKRHWNPDDPNQFFWIDDAFGPTQYQRAIVDAWNQELPALRAAIKLGARVLFTSRTYIWEAARHDLKLSQFPLLGKSQVIIDVQGLSEDERAQILYNHLRMGDQPKGLRETLKPLLPSAATSASFLPETARRLGSSFFTSSLVQSDEGVTEFFEKPVEFLKEVLENLDLQSQAAIALIFLHGQRGVSSPLDGSDAAAVVQRLFGVSLAEIGRALEALNGSLTLLVAEPTGGRWVYKHPTIRDAFAALVAGSTELIELYIVGARLDRLLGEVICGTVEIEGASVRVPEKMYDLMLARLQRDPKSYYVRRFISARCDVNFLKRFIDAVPDFVDWLVGSIHASMAYDASTDVLARLNGAALLTETERAAAVAQITRLTIEMADSSVFRDNALRSILTAKEFKRLTRRFRTQIIGNLGHVIASWDEDWMVDDRRAHLEELKASFDHYALFTNYPGDEPKVRQARDQLCTMIEQIEEAEDPPAERHAAPTSPVGPSTTQLSTIFDDVDE
jgi:hypothetical protein